VVDNYVWIMLKDGTIPPTQTYFAWIMKPEGDEVEGREKKYRVVDEVIEDAGAMVCHLGYVGLILLAPLHEVAQLLSSLDWVL